MKDHMSRLSQIVKIDQEIQALKEQLEEIPSHVRDISAQLNKLDADIAKKKVDSDKIEGEIKKVKNDLEAETQRLKAKEERLHAIKTNKEYQAVLKEISSAKISNKDRETSLQKLAGDLEEIQKVVAPLQGQKDELAPKLESAQSEIEGSLQELEEKRKTLEAQFNEQMSSLPEDIRHKYRRIQEKRQPAAARVIAGTCQECFINVPPQLFIEIQKTQEIYSCPNCHRLLYIE